MSTPEKSIVFERLDLQRPLAIGHFDAHAAARGERDDLIGRKRPLGENVEHFAADIAGRADDCDGETHRQTPSRFGLRPLTVRQVGALLGQKCRQHNAGQD